MIQHPEKLKVGERVCWVLDDNGTPEHLGRVVKKEKWKDQRGRDNWDLEVKWDDGLTSHHGSSQEYIHLMPYQQAFSLPYGRMHNENHKINPKTGKHLIPLRKDLPKPKVGDLTACQYPTLHHVVKDNIKKKAPKIMGFKDWVLSKS